MDSNHQPAVEGIRIATPRCCMVAIIFAAFPCFRSAIELLYRIKRPPAFHNGGGPNLKSKTMKTCGRQTGFEPATFPEYQNALPFELLPSVQYVVRRLNAELKVILATRASRMSAVVLSWRPLRSPLPSRYVCFEAVCLARSGAPSEALLLLLPEQGSNL